MSHGLRCPPALPSRPVIRVVHPSGTLIGHEAALHRGLARLEAEGAEIRWRPARARDQWRGYLAGDDDTRALELVSALTEPGVDAVWFARGGSGATRIVQRVIKALAQATPRILVGFSDATAILNALSMSLGWTTFHGPVVTSLGRADIDCDLGETFSLLSGATRTLHFDRQPGQPVVGALFGGNLTVLAASVGAFNMNPTEAQIWLLEEVGEVPYRMDRSWTQLVNAGVFGRTEALWLGDLGLKEAAAIQRAVEADLGCPALLGAPAGHAGRLATIPLGRRVRIIPEQGLLEAVDPWLQAR